uniref:heavy metal translocating P-type ATPase n=1 Tax=Polynucleobacter sp. TaxID=2029855 RepID=UPI004047FCEB
MSQLVTLNIRGMTCASCVARLEKSLSKVAGVDAASVNLATEKAQIRVNQELHTITDLLITAIEKAGFEASVFSHQSASATTPSNIFDLHGKKAVILAIVLSLPLLAPMLLMPFGVHWMLPAWAQFLLATPVQFILGSRFYVAGFKALRMGSGNMDLLVALGTTAAYGLSIYTWYLSDWGRAYEPHELYFESSAVVISLVMLGKWLEARAKKETTTAITALQSLWPDQAKLLRQHDLNQLDYEHLPIAQILPGDWVLVLPGERIPVDGLVIEGLSEIDESMLTGESRLLEKEKGSTVIGGSLNGSGRLIIQATGIGETSVLAKMIALVENAQAEKAPIQRLVDQVSAWFVPVVVLIAAINFLIHALIFNDSQNALLYSVAILVIACPCALGLATPVAIMAGTGVAAKFGILIKDAQALELAHRINIVAFDKTGTLTMGKPSVKNFTNFSTSDDQQIHALALGLQMSSEHPLAKAMIQFGQQHQVNAEGYATVLANIGKGIEGQCLTGSYQSKTIAFVSFHAIKAHASEQIQMAAMNELNLGHSVSCLVDVMNSSTKQILALYSFGDELKSGVNEAIQRLKLMNIKTIMISGDNQLVANLLAQKIGIDEVYAEVLPAEKAAIIQSLKAINGRSYVAMVGDGVNDAPALAVADVGIAVSTGADIAMHAASITLMRGDPASVPDAIEISAKTWQKIKQNLFWAFVYNLIGIPLAALGYLTPMIAGAAMAASSVSVVGNALLLRKWSRPKP